MIPIFRDSGALRSRMSFSKAHFIGIAGKGMSATALLLRQMGARITGSDEGFYPPVSDYLRNEGSHLRKDTGKRTFLTMPTSL
jgi:UDP-N-acetylmuramate-alanine ligase